MSFLFCEVNWYIKIHGSPGLKNPEIMEFWGFGPSHEKTKIRLDQNEAEQSPRAFKPII